jgi:hypothetical protein
MDSYIDLETEEKEINIYGSQLRVRLFSRTLYVSFILTVMT